MQRKIKKYICGDFNFDLLKTDTDHSTQHFFNLLCSYGLLPHILQPTRVTENTASVIDNIFSNNLQDDISGNVLLTLSNHFSQIISVSREQSREKMSIRETQNIQARAFVMYQSKTGIILIIMLMTLLKTSLQNLMQLLTGMLH